MGELIGYARVSTVEQSPQLQEDALRAAGVVRVFVDVASGGTASRPQLDAALDYAREGDVLVVWRLDRAGRSLKHLISLVSALDERGIGFRSLTESIDTTTAGGRLIFHVFGALAEFERDLIRDRTTAGLAAARARGRKGGRPAKLTPAAREGVRAMRASNKTLQEIADAFGVSRTTIIRVLQSAGNAAAPGTSAHEARAQEPVP